MDDKAIYDYVSSASTLQGLGLNDAEIARVALIFGRTATIASQLLGHTLLDHEEPAPVFRASEQA